MLLVDDRPMSPSLRASRCHRYLGSRRHIRIGLFLSLTALALYALYGNALRTAVLSIQNPFATPYTDDVPPLDVDWDARAEQVKDSFRHAYGGYERYASPADELRPLSKSQANPFNGWGVTIFDSLDTMLLMGLDDEFKRAMEFVKTISFTMPEEKYAPYFETVIRYLGGMLSAYALSGDRILLQRSDELAELLDPAFHPESGLPTYGINTATGNFTKTHNVGLAEIASLQLEYSYLAKATGKKKWQERSDKVVQTLYNANIDKTGGMLPTRWNISSGQPIDSEVSVGGQADSAHEYLLKQYLLTGNTDKASLELYLRGSTHMLTRLLYLTPNRHLLYATNARKSSQVPNDWPTHEFEHLSCFLPGLLALGAHMLPLDILSPSLRQLPQNHDYGSAREGYTILSRFSSLKEMHMTAAEGLAMTCWLSYADQPTGLGPEIMRMGPSWLDEKVKPVLWIDAMVKWRWSGKKGAPPGTTARIPVKAKRDQDYIVRTADYLLRPETIESFYIMWKVTGDARWRQRGWLIYQAIERETRTEAGYAVLKSVTERNSRQDEMPSFFLAETLKYLYLLFREDDLLPLDKWVLNTEAHPFPIFNLTHY